MGTLNLFNVTKELVQIDQQYSGTVSVYSSRNGCVIEHKTTNGSPVRMHFDEQQTDQLISFFESMKKL